jgi:hypothetical protein
VVSDIPAISTPQDPSTAVPAVLTAFSSAPVTVAEPTQFEPPPFFGVQPVVEDVPLTKASSKEAPMMSTTKLIGILVLVVAIFAAVIAGFTLLAALLPRSVMIGVGAVAFVIGVVVLVRDPAEARKFFLPKR